MESQAQVAGLPGERSGATSDDRIWAALAHASALLMFFGPLVPLIIWDTQRKKSNYASFQALQAMAYQALFFWVWMLVAPLVAIVVMVMALAVSPAANPQSANPPLAVFGMQLAIFGVIIGSMLLFVAVGLVGAAACLGGREFRYPLVGSRLARFLEYQGGAMAEAKQDRLIAAVSHSTCIILLWGLITPIVAWLTEHDRSAFLRFQALQAAVYQGIGAIAYFAVFAVYMAFIFASLGVATVLESHSSSAPLAWIAVFMLPILCIICAAALAMPLYHLFGFLAALATLRGRDYRYPILGSILASRMKNEEAK